MSALQSQEERTTGCLALQEEERESHEHELSEGYSDLDADSGQGVPELNGAGLIADPDTALEEFRKAGGTDDTLIAWYQSGESPIHLVRNDIQPEMLRFIERKEKELGLSNVSAHLGTLEDTKLPVESIDAALLVDAYHEFSHPYEMMTSLVKALRSGGRVFLLEYRAEDPELRIKPLHKMTHAQAKREMEAVGLHWKETHDFLPWQHLMVFEKRQAPSK